MIQKASMTSVQRVLQLGDVWSKKGHKAVKKNAEGNLLHFVAGEGAAWCATRKGDWPQSKPRFAAIGRHSGTPTAAPHQQPAWRSRAAAERSVPSGSRVRPLEGDAPSKALNIQFKNGFKLSKSLHCKLV